MEATVDSGGRILVPKALRESLGLLPGSTVDISQYGGGLTVVPAGRTARVVHLPDGGLVAEGDNEITDEMVFALMEAWRR